MIKGYRSRLREINSQTKNLNQAEIARQIGISRQTVNRWMSDALMRQPDMIVANALAAFYGLANPMDVLEAVRDESPELVALPNPA